MPDTERTKGALGSIRNRTTYAGYDEGDPLEALDELDTPEAQDESIDSRGYTSIRDRMTLWTAEGFGLGRLPVAPGTWGSLGATVIFGGLDRGLPDWSIWGIVVLTAVVSIPVCGRAEDLLAREDPSRVVMDEVVGQWLALLPVLCVTGPGPVVAGYATGFVLFRVFDITKPYPADQLQDLPGGWGVVLDDCMAGVYTAFFLSLLLVLLHLPE